MVLYNQSLLKVALGDPDWLPVVKEEPEHFSSLFSVETKVLSPTAKTSFLNCCFSHREQNK